MYHKHYNFFYSVNMDWSNTNATLMSWPKHSALTTIRQEGTKIAVAATQDQSEMLRAALQSSSGEVCCNNTHSSKVCLDMNYQFSLKKNTVINIRNHLC